MTTITRSPISCRLCKSAETWRVINLGHHPLADRFLTEKMLYEPEMTYPLQIFTCKQCGYVGLEHEATALSRYVESEYSYTAGNSPVAVAHFSELARAIADRCGFDRADPLRVIDIGGNDGTLLNAIRTRREDTIVLNIEPSPVMAAVSRENGIPTAECFWATQYHMQIDHVWPDVMFALTPPEQRHRLAPNRRGEVDLCVCTNVFNHTTNPALFVSQVREVLKPGGWFVFEVPALSELVGKCALDTIYAEHISYFGLRPLRLLLARHGMTIMHAEITPYMGGSLRVFASKHRPVADVTSAGFQYPPGSELEPSGIYKRETLADLITKFDYMRKALRASVHEHRKDGPVIAIGAAAKGNTLLNYCGFDASMISAVVDTSLHKIGKYTPGSHIPIVGDDGLLNGQYAGAAALILPWNIADHIRQRYASSGLEFIVPAH